MAVPGKGKYARWCALRKRDTLRLMTFTVERSIEVLRRTPQQLRVMLDGLSAEWTHVNEGENTWSAYDVIGHLVHGERTDWIPRAQLILAQGANRTFAPFDRFAQFRESEGKSLADLLGEFEAVRGQSLRALASWELTDAQLLLTGEHPAFGTVTLRQLLATWVAHDLGHVAQVARVMAKQYGNEVGPWREYLSVLGR